MACDRPTLRATRRCPYCGEAVADTRGLRLARRLLPVAMILLLAMAWTDVGCAAVADACRRATTEPGRVTLLALGLALALLPPRPTRAVGAPPPASRFQRLWRLVAALLYALAVVMAAMLFACGGHAPVRHLLLPALAFAALLFFPCLYQLPPWPLAAAPLIWLAGALR